MSDKRFTPKALDKAQADTLTVANTWAQNDTATLTINEKDLVLTVGASFATTDVATALKEMVNGDSFTVATHAASETGDNVAEWEEVSATVSSSVVTVTGDTKGKPFTMTAAEVTAGTGTVTQATSIAATGVNWWDNVDNWGGSAIPADTDVVYLDSTDTDIFYGLGQSAIEPAAVYIAMSFEGDIGLPEYSEEGEYHEYRTTYLEIGPAILQIGAGGGNGSGRIKINSTSDVCAVTVVNTGSSADANPAFIWKGTNVANTMVVRGGSVGVAVFGAETATIATLTVDDGDVTLGAGTTLSGVITVNGGVVRVNSKIDGSLVLNGGTVVIEGTADVDQLTIRGGTCVLNTTGTLGGATTISGDGVLDLSGNPTALTAVSAAIDMYGPNSRILDPHKRLGNVAVDGNEGADPGTQVTWGVNYRLSRAATA
jgi:hypothetical protein